MVFSWPSLEELDFRQEIRQDVLVLLIGLTAPLVVILGGKWKANAERHGQEPAEPFRIAGNFYYVGALQVPL